MASEKGKKFSTEIGSDVIDAALGSVRRHRRGSPGDAGQGPEAPEASETPVEAGAPAASAEPVEPGELEELRAQLELSMAKGREMMEKVKESHERMLRAVADLENYKKRAQKEKEEVQKFGIEKLLKDMLPVLDNLDRALDHAKTQADFPTLKEGVGMTRRLFEEALAKGGVKPFVSVGQPFDPRFHEAMQQVETKEVPPNHVVSEIVRGYLLHDRLVRPTLVMVSKADAAGGEGGQTTPDASESSGG